MKKHVTTLLVFLGVVGMALAAFDDVTLNAGTDLRVTVGGAVLDLTVTNGRAFLLNVNDGNLTGTLSAGSSLDLTSADRRSFTYTIGNATANFTCDLASSVLTISLPAGADQTFTITPTAGTCASSLNNGGGGGGIPVDNSSPLQQSGAKPPVALVQVPPVNVPAPVVPAPIVANPSPIAQAVSPVFNKNLKAGSRNDDVKRLQQLLMQDKSIYPEGLVTGYFGKATTAAVKRFQVKYKIPATGRVGPKTRAKLKEIFGQ